MELKYLPILLLIPVLFAGTAKFLLNTTITYKEMVIHFLLGIVFSVSVFYITVYTANYDTYYVHGKVTDKTKEQVSCRHSYQTCVGSGNNRVCFTKYRHSYDNEYVIHSTIGNYEVSPPDSQGLIAPRRWEQAIIGEHYADTFSFQNYLANSDYSIMNKKYEHLNLATPSRPKIYDLYRMDPVTSTGIHPEVEELNAHLTNKLKENNRKYNLNIVLVSYESTDYQYAIIKNWKPVLNDVIVVVNTFGDIIEWSEAITYANGLRNEALITDIRHDISGMKLDTKFIDVLINIADEKYQQPSEKDFERLKFEMELTNMQWICIFVFNLIFNIAVSAYMHRNDL